MRGGYRPAPLLSVDHSARRQNPRAAWRSHVRDRVIQTAVALVLTPIFEAIRGLELRLPARTFVKRAVERVLRYRDWIRWVVDRRHQRLFDSLDRPADECGARTVADARILALIEQWIGAPLLIDGVERRPPRASRRGSRYHRCSPTVYLDRLDEVIARENLRLVRYADDFLILCKDRPHAEEALEITGSFSGSCIWAQHRKTRVVHFDQGFRFLGSLSCARSRSRARTGNRAWERR